MIGKLGESLCIRKRAKRPLPCSKNHSRFSHLWQLFSPNFVSSNAKISGPSSVSDQQLQWDHNWKWTLIIPENTISYWILSLCPYWSGRNPSKLRQTNFHNLGALNRNKCGPMLKTSLSKDYVTSQKTQREKNNLRAENEEGGRMRKDVHKSWREVFPLLT